MGDWGTGSDAFGSNDAFGNGGDVFGRDFEDVDPFKAHDSFEGDLEWDQFNGDEGDDFDSGSETEDSEVNSEEDENTRRRERRSDMKTPSSSSSSHRRKPSSPSASSHRDRDRDRRRKSSSGSGRKSESSSRRSSSRGATSSSGGGRRSRSGGSHHRGERSERSERRSDRRSTHSSSSNTKSRSSHHRQSGNELSPRSRKSTSGGEREHSSRGGSRHSRSPQKASRQTVSRSVSHDGFDTAAFGSFGGNDDPFGVGGSPPTTSRSADGFGDFADFGDAIKTPTSQHQNTFANFGTPATAPPLQSGFDDDFADFANERVSSSRPAKQRSGLYRGAEEPRQQRRNSNSSQNQEHSTHSAASTRFRLRSKNNGAMRPLRRGEKNQMVRASSERRSAIKDSLFDALGEDDPNDGMTLSSFLGGENSKRGGRRNGGGGSVSGDASIHSAPAILRPPLSRGRRSTSGGANESLSAAGSTGMAGKSRRYQRKMGLPPTARDTPTKHKEPMKLDIAALAEQGYLEVQDGKMRLVIDMDNAGDQ